MKLGELASRLGCGLEGDSQIEILGVAGIEAARPGEVTFLTNSKYGRALSTTRASAVLVNDKADVERAPQAAGLAVLRSKNPYLDFARTIEIFHTPRTYSSEIHPTAVIAASAKVGAGAHVGPYCYIEEGVEIGQNAVLHSFVTIYKGARIGNNFLAHSQTVVRENCTIGDRVILQNGAVVGADGFGFAKRADGSWHKIAQHAPVVVEDDVEIQANSCIDRATVGETRIRRGAKIDDLVLVGHACEVGENSLLCGQVGLAGSTHVGKGCILAGQVGSAGHLEIGDGAVISSKSGIHQDVPAGGFQSGYPAVENKLWLRMMAALKRLPEMQKTIRQISGELSRIRKAQK